MDSESGAEIPAPETAARAPEASRATAVLEVLICSGYPTQLALASLFAALGFRARGDTGLDVSFVVALSIIDAVVLVGLMVVFLRVRGEQPRLVFFGSGNAAREMLVGLPMSIGALMLAIAILLPLQLLAPWLHTVPRNPLQDLIQTPVDAALFALVVVVAGGIREELQRAFLLHRFEQHLGGARVGLVVTSLSFGVGHLLQGADAVIATAALGAFWGVVYLRRRSALAPIVSHAGFNLLQLAQFLLVPR